jgi:hypothetical protein
MVQRNSMRPALDDIHAFLYRRISADRTLSGRQSKASRSVR